MEPNLPVDPSAQNNKANVTGGDSNKEDTQKAGSDAPRFKPLLGNLADSPAKESLKGPKVEPSTTAPASSKTPSNTGSTFPGPRKARTSYMVSGVRKAEVNVKAATAPMERASRWPLYAAWVALAGLAGFTLWEHQRISALHRSLQSGVVSTNSGQNTEEFLTLKSRAEKSEENYQDLLAQFNAASKRLEQSEQLNQRLNAQVKDLVTQFNLNKHLAQPTTGNSEGLESASINVAELSPAHRELLLVKERNRITAFADTAIATGEREPYDRLWVIMENPELASLAHAARAEILRVQNFYLSGSRISHYNIVVGNYFPDQADLKDHQLSDAQLIILLEKKDAPWQVRLKAANLLGRRKSLSNAEALVKAIKEDKNLDVVKESTFSFEQITGYHARIFQYEELAEWWDAYKKQLEPGAQPSPAAPPSAPSTADAPVTPKKQEPAPPKADAPIATPKAQESAPKSQAPAAAPKSQTPTTSKAASTNNSTKPKS